MSQPGLPGKSHDIPKRLIWAAWLKVKSNGGAAGADGVTIEQFESRLADNLYRLWNRMSSGSYFPGPVRAVEIPKKGGVIHEGAGPVKSSLSCSEPCFSGGSGRFWAGVCAVSGSRRSARRRSRGRTALRPTPCASCWWSRDEEISGQAWG